MAFDKDKIHKVLMNLLSNAIKYAGIPGKITVKIWIEDEKVFTSVADNGKGIEDNEKCKVFDAFYQIADEKSSYGSGIGLHIVKELLSLHHGDIHIEDNLPTGAKFIFYIPITPMEQIVETEFQYPTDRRRNGIFRIRGEKRKSGSKHPTHCRRQPRLTLIFIRFSKKGISYFFCS